MPGRHSGHSSRKSRHIHSLAILFLNRLPSGKILSVVDWAMSRWPNLIVTAVLTLGLMSATGPVSAAGLSAAALSIEARIMLNQNRERTALGLSNLVWDPALAAAAQTYAGDLAKTDKWQHSPAASRVGQGENLWMGTRGAFAIDDMVDAWLAERAVFRAGTFPFVSTTGNWEDVGHYTQIIWPGNRRVGCSIDSSASFDYLVCRYAEPGNVMGEPVLRRPQVASSK